jgi:hypothetical protein
MGKEKSTNAGVHAITGFEFQKHCIVYLLIENWEELQDKKYFISIEHHDDFLFCFQDEKDLINYIESYQAKKSSSEWGMTKKFYTILNKILEVGRDLKSDKTPKASTYSHSLFFLTNNSIKIPNNTINETNTILKFINLDSENQEKIKKGIQSINTDISEIDNVSFLYIDFSKTSQAQKDQLIGLFSRIFGDKVADHKAAIETLLSLFREIELTFNQGNTISLMDKSKQLQSNKITKAINVITTKSKAYDLWRSKKEEIGSILKIPISSQDEFKLAFENSFDLFKDLEQREHQKIYQFVKDNRELFDSCYSNIDCINQLYNLAIKSEVLRQNQLHLKAALFAAYIEFKDN